MWYLIFVVVVSYIGLASGVKRKRGKIFFSICAADQCLVLGCVRQITRVDSLKNSNGY